jgi:hypothetical protein
MINGDSDGHSAPVLTRCEVKQSVGAIVTLKANLARCILVTNVMSTYGRRSFMKVVARKAMERILSKTFKRALECLLISIDAFTGVYRLWSRQKVRREEMDGGDWRAS